MYSGDLFRTLLCPTFVLSCALSAGVLAAEPKDAGASSLAVLSEDVLQERATCITTQRCCEAAGLLPLKEKGPAARTLDAGGDGRPMGFEKALYVEHKLASKGLRLADSKSNTEQFRLIPHHLPHLTITPPGEPGVLYKVKATWSAELVPDYKGMPLTLDFTAEEIPDFPY